MIKGAQTRLDETIDYIVDRVPIGEQTVVRQFVEGKVRTFHGGVRAGIRGMSSPMSMSGLAERGTADERKKRRSIMLMIMAYITGPVAGAAKTMSVMELTARFTEYIGVTRLLASQSEHGTGARILEKYNALIANPLDFLGTHIVHCFGAGHSGAMQQSFFFEYTNGVGKYKFTAHVPGTARGCPRPTVVNVPAVLWSAVPNRTNNPAAGTFADIQGTRLTGGTCMVTTQFSGCSFCFKDHGGSVYAAHISPDDPNQHGAGLPAHGGFSSGTRLARQLAGLEGEVTGGDFAAPAPGGGNFMVYGAGYSNIVGHDTGYPPNAGGNYMTLIGTSHGGAWRFYSQHVNANGTIARVVQIL